MSDISTNLLEVRKNIERSAKKVGRDPANIILVCVTKQIPIELIQKVINLGISIIGESRIEEARTKWGELPKDITWHMIGHLQTRKVKEAVNIFYLIHSVDSIRLAKEIDKRSRAINKIQNVLIEVNISGEKSKYGMKENEVISNIKEISKFNNIKICGLMTMAPFVADPELTRPVFKGLRELNEKISSLNIPNVCMKYLSMGMTQDYTVAIEEGANMVRIGTGIFS